MEGGCERVRPQGRPQARWGQIRSRAVRLPATSILTRKNVGVSNITKRVGAFAVLGIACVGVLRLVIRRPVGPWRREKLGPAASHAGLETPSTEAAVDVRPIETQTNTGSSPLRRFGAALVSVILLLGLGCLASAIDASENAFPESIYWPEQPSASVGIFMSRANADLLQQAYARSNECVADWGRESGSDVDPVYMTAPGWKLSVEGAGSDTLSGVAGFGYRKVINIDGITTAMTDVVNSPPKCRPSLGGRIPTLQLPTDFSYALTGPFADIYGDQSLTRESCALWTTQSGRSGSAYPTVENEGNFISIKCAVQETEPLTDIHLRVAVKLRNDASSPNLAGYSTWVLNNDGVQQAIARGREGQPYVGVPSATYEVVVTASTGSEILSTNPGQLGFGVRQFALTTLKPGESMLVRSANTVRRSVGATVRQFAWMAMGVVAGALALQVTRRPE